jgi:chromosome segregation ATPase
MNKQQLEKPGSALASIQELNHTREKLFRGLLDLSENINLIKEGVKFKHVYTELVSNESEIDALEAKIISTRNSVRQQVVGSLKANDNSDAAANQQLTSNLQNKDATLNASQDELSKTQADLRKANEKYADLIKKNTKALEKVKEIVQLITDEKKKNPLGKNWKNVLDLVYPKIATLESFIEN